jgi:Bacterial capsule synthesis protein PGA_cap
MSKTIAPPPDTTVTISAVGDTMMGKTPALPLDPGSYFSAVSSVLRGHAQIVFGNLEGTLTTATGGKCGTDTQNCFAFRAPPAFAADLRHAGFTVLNNANNHSGDIGPAGQEQTVSALRAAGIAQTGLPGEITVVRARGVRVAFVAFAPYTDTANLLDLPAARALIRRARLRADLVVVYMHAGAEGSDADDVTGQEETYVGEDRGNPEAFAHMAIDAGADLVIASGPHVVRGMEFHHRHLIAYSLGNFAGYENFGLGGLLSTSCILQVTLRGDGSFVSARIIPTEPVGQGQPAPGGDAVSVIAQLSRDDFASHAAHIAASGDISAP